MSGHLRLLLHDGSTTACNHANENVSVVLPPFRFAALLTGDDQGIFVPPLRNLRYVDVSSLRWILVVEKEVS